MFEALAAHFPADAVSWRVGNTNVNKQTGKPPESKAASGMALAYIDARDVMDRFDAVCGPEGWQRRHPQVGGTTTCEIDIWVEGRGWVVKSDGAGDTDYEAQKGSLSDSFKRAAVNWGVGRYLYNLPSPWVEIEGMGKSWKIKASEMGKLHALLTKTASAATPAAPQSKPVITKGAEVPKTPTLAERADKLIKAMQAQAGNPEGIQKAYALGSGLCADLDLKDPDKLAEVEFIFKGLLAEQEVFA